MANVKLFKKRVKGQGQEVKGQGQEVKNFGANRKVLS
jgi:hypothetical protein